MKIKKLVISNIGMIGDETVEFNKPLNLFYGDVRQGKTTILNAIKLCFGGSFPDDIIKHGEKKASVELYFDKTCITRKFRQDKHGVTKADKIEFVNDDGETVDKPVDAIAKFLNPFLLNQNHLMDMNEPSRKRFFIELFDVDTATIDTELKESEQSAKDLRLQIGAYGDVSRVIVEKVDVEVLREEKSTAIEAFETSTKADRESNTKITNTNNERDRGTARIAELQGEVEERQKKVFEIETWLSNNPAKTIKDIPCQADTIKIDTLITEGVAQNVRHEQYLKDQGQASLKAEAQDTLTDTDEKIRDLRKDKAALLSGINDKCTIKGLLFDDFGNFEYEGTTAGMLSTSQLMRLSSDLSKLYPEGFGLELIDRGESIGKDIFLFVEKAKAENKTILATIVGEKPADVPDEIGVFVVDNGQIK